MASTRKSSRVRVPKIREDAATPQKRSKPNVPAAAAAAAAAAASVVSSAPPVVIPAVPSPSVAVIPPAPLSTSPLDVISVPVSLESGLGAGVEESDSLSATGTADGGEEMVIEKVATAIFKNPTFVHSSIGAAGSKRTRLWKNLKQIISSERSLPWQNTDVSYGLIDGPPSFKPAKKYSDLSGFEAPYTDPQTKLRFSSPEEFNRARTFPSDIVNGYLALRKASAPVP
ncbi:INO80 complex subunit C-like [Babylonia areolata]|uniref:INO80 complex subunit C-like n=1 Tax=Babylonia areolata TaxID=304850 RepID=UPI003FD02AD6